MAELSLVKFFFTNIYAVIINARPFTPTASTLIKLLIGLVESEPEKDKELLNKVFWIYNNTHEKLKTPLTIVEKAVYMNIGKSLISEVNFEHKSFTLIELHRYLDDIGKFVGEESVKIAKKYNLDIPLMTFNQNSKGFNFNE
jgi:hypothetical protein